MIAYHNFYEINVVPTFFGFSRMLWRLVWSAECGMMMVVVVVAVVVAVAAAGEPV